MQLSYTVLGHGRVKVELNWNGNANLPDLEAFGLSFRLPVELCHVDYYGLGPVENLRAETSHGDSRFDFSFTLDGRPCFLEVKGVTLENDGVCAFPDAPTERGTRHLRGLQKCVAEGCGGYVLFVIQMSDVKYLHPNDTTDPNFGCALREAAAAGVTVLAMDCAVTEDSMVIRKPVLVNLK